LTQDELESSNLGRTGPDLLRGCLLPCATVVWIIFVGFLCAGGIGVIITIIHNLIG
jgi:hypothetical protein